MQPFGYPQNDPNKGFSDVEIDKIQDKENQYYDEEMAVVKRIKRDKNDLQALPVCNKCGFLSEVQE